MTTASATTSRAGRARRRPLASHRWFAPALGMWFAALFGGCALVLPVQVFESVVGASGLDRVLAAAAPPLGETAHLLIAAALSSVGEIFGLVLGRVLGAYAGLTKVARSEPQPVAAESEPEPELAKAEPAPRKPISAFAELAPEHAAPDTAVAAEEPPLEVAEIVRHEERPLDRLAEELAAPEPLPAPPPPEAHRPGHALAAVPLDGLGVVQLSERLALALQARTETRPSRADAAAAKLAESARALVAMRTEFAGDSGEKPTPGELLASLRRMSGTR